MLLCSLQAVVTVLMCCYGVVSVLSVAMKLPGHCNCFHVLLCSCYGVVSVLSVAMKLPGCCGCFHVL